MARDSKGRFLPGTGGKPKPSKKRTGFKMDSGWRDYAKAIDEKKFLPILKKHVERETYRAALMMQKRVRASIRGGKYTPNAALTTMIKGKGKKPLVDGGDLFQAIAVVKKSWSTFFVGVVRTHDQYNIAVAIHDGRKVAVTDKMRKLFWVLWLASTGSIDPSSLSGRAAELWERAPGGWKPLRPSTTHIVIPPRRFIMRVFERKAAKALIEKRWRNAIKRAIKEAAKQG